MVSTFTRHHDYTGDSHASWHKQKSSRKTIRLTMKTQLSASKIRVVATGEENKLTGCGGALRNTANSSAGDWRADQ